MHGEKETCENCRYVKHMQAQSGKRQAFCIRNPPTPMLVPVQNVLANQQVLMLQGIHPPVPASLFCGEYMSTESKLKLSS